MKKISFKTARQKKLFHAGKLIAVKLSQNFRRHCWGQTALGQLTRRCAIAYCIVDLKLLELFHNRLSPHLLTDVGYVSERQFFWHGDFQREYLK